MNRQIAQTTQAKIFDIITNTLKNEDMVTDLYVYTIMYRNDLINEVTFTQYTHRSIYTPSCPHKHPQTNINT